jgi:hypothetical protein
VRRRRFAFALAPLSLATPSAATAAVASFAALAACSSSSPSSTAVDAGDPYDLLTPPKSCAYACPSDACAEATAAYACPALGKWNEIPHDDPCGTWDAKYPTPTTTKCTVSAPSGDAAKYAGVDPDDPATHILPDGRRVKSAGVEWRFDEKELFPSGPIAVLPVPQTTLAIVVDAADGTHSVRSVDLAKLGSASPVVSLIPFAAPLTLTAGVVFIAPDLVLVATVNGAVQAFKLDTTSGVLTKDDTRSIALPASIDDQKKPAPYYVAGLAASPDQTRLVVTSQFDTRALVFDLTPGTGYGKALGKVDIGDGGGFRAAFDPNDPSGRFAYASRWGGRAVIEIDLGDPTAPKLSRTFKVEKNPEGIAFLDARWMIVANDFGDSFSLVDRTSGAVTIVPVDASSPLHGTDPSALAYDKTNKRLYATLAGVNALGAWDVDLAASSPKLSPAGRLPTSWWPTDVSVLPSGALVVTTMRGHSSGALDQRFPPNDGDSSSNLSGTIARIDLPAAADLVDGDKRVRAYNDVGHLGGAPVVTCPNGENDFAVPGTNTEGPSKQIEHVVFLLRENKTFDGIFGDLPGVNGDPSLTMKKSPDDMDRLWKNLRTIARTFAVSDNYYTDAEISNQGHTWTTYGRSSDFTERTWHLNGYARSVWSSPAQPQGISDIGTPEEGSLFDWLENSGVKIDILGEGEGTPRKPLLDGHTALDARYPGGPIQSIGYPDVEKSCYLAGRARLLCNFSSFAYATLPNDHTLSAQKDRGSPETMIAVNDEATGMVIDAISHSPMWARTLIVITEDDPANGGDHVEHHRVPIAFVSPWVKRGYVSKTHIDVSALHKLFAHIFGIPYENAIVAGAGLPLDLFSSTPDYTPYTYAPREWPLTCGKEATLAETKLTASWSFDEEDRQPGLDAQLWRLLRGEPLEKLTPKMERQIAERARLRDRTRD